MEVIETKFGHLNFVSQFVRMIKRHGNISIACKTNAITHRSLLNNNPDSTLVSSNVDMVVVRCTSRILRLDLRFYMSCSDAEKKLFFVRLGGGNDDGLGG